jgi:hypothetical protein
LSMGETKSELAEGASGPGTNRGSG